MEFVKIFQVLFQSKYFLIFLDTALWNVIEVFVGTFLFLSICDNNAKSITYFLFILLMFLITESKC